MRPPCFVEGWYTYTARDKTYMITAIPITISKFGPSGSLKKKNISLEHAIDVIPKISNEIFFELKPIVVIILENLLAGSVERLLEINYNTSLI